MGCTAWSLLGSMQDKLWGVRKLLRMCVLAGCGLGLAAVLPALGQSAKLGYSEAPDTIFYDGSILTGTRLKAGDADPTPGRVNAVAIRAGKIVALGGDAAMLALKDSHTKTVDLKGTFAMPGFNDAHTHMAFAGRQRLTVDLDNVASLAAMLAQVQAYATKLGPGEWIVGGGWDHTKWVGAKLPTRQELDAVSAGHPAFLERTDGHIAIVNTAALKAAGITDATIAPKGGQIDRDAEGHATGILREGPMLTMVVKVIPPPSLAMRRKGIELSMNDALAHGVTSIQDFSDWEDFLAMEEMEHQGTLHLRIAEWIEFAQPVGVLDERRASHPADDLLLHTTMLKGFMDGSLGSRTAAMSEAYADDPNNLGIARYDQSKLNEMATARAADGFQLGFHAIGDAANDMALNAFSAAEQVGRPANLAAAPKNVVGGVVMSAQPGAVKPSDFRFRIEHAQVVSPGAFDRFAALGVIASMQPSHLLTDMAWAEARLGPERVKRAYAWKSFLDHGVTLAFGTDYPVESISPFRGLYAAITRQNVEGTQTFQPQEKLTINEAIYAYTQASAFAEFREKIKGRLEPGYLADIVVLDRDITKATPQEVLHTQVLRTVVGGETVYQAP
jgi:predicted amidohydrolase YtcJ